MKQPFSAFDVYKGRAALADRKINKVAATSRRRAFATDSRYEASATEGAYEVFPENTAAYELFESSGSYSDEPRGYGEEYDFCEVNYTDGSPRRRYFKLQLNKEAFTSLPPADQATWDYIYYSTRFGICTWIMYLLVHWI